MPTGALQSKTSCDWGIQKKELATPRRILMKLIFKSRVTSGSGSSYRLAPPKLPTIPSVQLTPSLQVCLYDTPTQCGLVFFFCAEHYWANVSSSFIWLDVAGASGVWSLSKNTTTMCRPTQSLASARCQKLMLLLQQVFYVPAPNYTKINK